jgi:hypothetical protein
MSDEERFLEYVRGNRHIGYGRMLQIIGYEWSESQPDRAAMEFTLAEGEPPTDMVLTAKQTDPLAHMWSRFKK